MALTRWVWIKEQNGSYVLAFTYVDPQAGPSAKGGVVTEAPESWKRAVEHPDRTFRDPKAFGAVAITDEEARRRGLPDEPPWLSIFTQGVARVPAVPDGRRIQGRVMLDGRPVTLGIEVKLGRRLGADFFPVDKATTAADGAFSFPMPAKGEHLLLAHDGGLTSAYVPATDAGPITLEVFRVAMLRGCVQKGGVAVRAQVAAEPIGHQAPRRICRAEADGTFTLSGLAPGRYAIEVMGLDAGGMSNGTPCTDEITVASGETLERAYTLIGGATVRVTVQTNDPSNGDNASVYLIAGKLTPRNRADVRPLFRSPAFRSANSTSCKAGIVSTEFLDVLPGTYTLCSLRDNFETTTDETPMVFVHIEVAGAEQDVRLELPL